MPATVIIRHDNAHLYAFPAAHITRVWAIGDTLNIAVADPHPHHKLRLTADGARHLVRSLGQAIVYYEHEPQMFTIDINQDGTMQTIATQPNLQEDPARS